MQVDRNKDRVHVAFGQAREKPHKAVTNDEDAIKWGATELLDSYRIESDMLELEDTFEFSLPYMKRLYGLSAPDTAIKLSMNNIIVMNGFIDSVSRRKSKRSGSTLSVAGRDRGGRLVDESAPLTSLLGLGVKELAEKMTQPWFPKVTLDDNTRNRRLFRYKARRGVRVSKEPGIFTLKHDKKVNPGDSRADVLGEYLREAHLLAWSSADGTEFIVGRPDYDQEPAFHFTLPTGPARFEGHTGVLDFEFTESVADMYSRVVVVGESKGDGVNYAGNVLRFQGVANDNPDNLTDGTGRAFQFRKVLVVQDGDVKSKALAKAKAQRELWERQSHNLQLELTVPGHSQLGTVYHFDSIATVTDPETFEKQSYYITRVVFTGEKSSGRRTELTMVPVGALLQMGGA